MVSALWSESVAAEVVVFFLLGPSLVRGLGPRGVMAVAAMAGVVRWVVVGSTTAVAALALVQPLHGLTFAALHLACMRVIATIVPSGLAATAQAMYALGAAAATALLTLASGCPVRMSRRPRVPDDGVASAPPRCPWRSGRAEALYEALAS
jgi:PPP family 3-phenylpropionic acid transporter